MADATRSGLLPGFFRQHLGTAGVWRWQLVAILIAAVIATPIITIAILALAPSGEVWRHLLATVLPSAFRQTVFLMAGVGLVTALLGAGTAWLVTMYQFPGSRILDWLLIVPLAMPTYITAYAYVELMDYTGPFQTLVRWAFGYESARNYWFPEIRSLGGAIFVMSCVLYPYVYLTARASFVQQSVCVLEVARTLGRTGFGVFHSVALPLARPAIVVGIALALMECLNDIGAVEFLGVNTLTRTVYATWLERSNLGGAAQIALAMLGLVLLLLAAERIARRRRYFYHTTGKYRPLPEQRLRGIKAWLATAACTVPVLAGFVLPFLALAKGAILYSSQTVTAAFWDAAKHSVFISATAAVISVALVIVLAFAMRLHGNRLVAIAARFAGVGYAVPGTVIAIGLLVPLAAIDNSIDAAARHTLGISTGLLLSGSAFALVLAYVVRFLAVALGAIESGFQKIPPNIDAAARALGATPGRMLGRVHLALLRPAIGAAALLVFVDSMKELPATLLLRPFNFETLSTHVYTFASLEQFSQAAPAALTIVLTGLAPLILLHRTIISGRPGVGKSPSPTAFAETVR